MEVEERLRCWLKSTEYHMASPLSHRIPCVCALHPRERIPAVISNGF